jgi:hypothetical protein
MTFRSTEADSFKKGPLIDAITAIFHSEVRPFNWMTSSFVMRAEGVYQVLSANDLCEYYDLSARSAFNLLSISSFDN